MLSETIKVNCPKAKSRQYIQCILTSHLFCHWLLVHQQNSSNKQVVRPMDHYWATLDKKSGKMPYDTKLGLPDFLKDDFLKYLNINNLGTYPVVC